MLTSRAACTFVSNRKSNNNNDNKKRGKNASNTRKIEAMITIDENEKWLKTTVYPEFGSFPNTKQGVPEQFNTLTKEEYEKNQEIEIIHGRWAMLAVSGVMAQENAGAGPWWEAGKECTATQCQISYAGYDFQASYGGAIFGLIFFEVLLLGSAEAYRTGILENPFNDGLPINTAYPGGRFDPLNYAKKENLDLMKIRELKHARLAMIAWLGILGQAVSTEAGAVSNFQAHINDVVHCNVIDRTGCAFF